MRKQWMWILAGLVMLLMVGCRPTPQPPGTDDPVDGGVVYDERAIVEQVDVVLMESFPVQARAIVKGQLPDGCTEIAEIAVSREGTRFTITIITQRPVAAVCTEAQVPFEEAVGLDVLGLEAGTYMVTAYGKTTTFKLEVKNSLSPV